MALGSRVKQIREAKQLSQAQLAEKVGLSQTAIHLMEQRDSTSSKFLVELAKALNVSPEWLKTGKQTQEDITQNRFSNVTIVSSDILEKRPEVPLLTWVSAGAWLQNHGSFTVTDAVRWLPCPVAHSKMTFALKVEGDSMTSPYPNDKSYPHGTLIYVDPEQQPYSGCRVVAFLVNEQAYTFKRYVEDMGKRYLKPINPSYESILITNDVEIVGVVIGAFID